MRCSYSFIEINVTELTLNQMNYLLIVLFLQFSINRSGIKYFRLLIVATTCSCYITSRVDFLFSRHDTCKFDRILSR
jgi:hypothetical protein